MQEQLNHFKAAKQVNILRKIDGIKQKSDAPTTRTKAFYVS